MSKLKVSGNASGTGVITLEAPNTNTDRTITLPDSSDTLVSTAPSTSGNILTSDGTNWTSAAPAAAGADTSLSNLSATGENKVCQAWVNFNGTGTVAINDSHNVSSITDLNTGRYQVNFSNSMANVNYSAIMQAVSISRVNPWVDTLATGSFKIYIHQSTNDTYYDCSVNTVVFGD